MSLEEIRESPVYELTVFGRDKIVDVAKPIANGPLVYKLVK
jgi:hypothetical protein